MNRNHMLKGSVTAGHGVVISVAVGDMPRPIAADAANTKA